MNVNINVIDLATKLAEQKVQEFYKRLNFLLNDKNYEDSVVETLYLETDKTGKKVRNQQAEEIFDKHYEYYFNLILTCEKDE